MPSNRFGHLSTKGFNLSGGFLDSTGAASETSVFESLTNLKINGSEDGYFVCSADGIIQDCNPAACNLLDIPASKMYRGLNMLDVLATVLIEQQHALSHKFDAVKEGRITNPLEIIVDTSATPRYVELQLFPIQQAERCWVLGTLRDTTHRKTIERELANSEARYRIVSDMVSDFAYSIKVGRDARGQLDLQVEWVTGAFEQITGIDLNSTSITKLWRKVTHPSDQHIVVENMRTILTGQNCSYEFRVRGHDGGYRWIRMFQQPVCAADDNVVVGVYGAGQDITEQKNIEMALWEARLQAESANLAKSSFLARMSHELRTPLTAILGYSELLIEDLQISGLHNHVADLHNIHQSAHHLFELVRDILNMSNIECERVELEVVNFELKRLVENVVHNLTHNIRLSQNQFEFDLEEGEIWLHSDPAKVSQVLHNLLSNAAKFTQNGQIRLSIKTLHRNHTPQIMLRVQDTGIGIAPENLNAIFEPFNQVDTSSKRRYGGAGLGLAITRFYVQLLEGEIEVSSVLGEGTEFTVFLPLTHSSAIDLSSTE
jgi:PAS domain S-box-containing protein